MKPPRPSRSRSCHGVIRAVVETPEIHPRAVGKWRRRPVARGVPCLPAVVLGQEGRRLPRRRARRRRYRRRPTRPAPDLPPRLLRRLRPRPGRQQRRGRLPPDEPGFTRSVAAPPPLAPHRPGRGLAVATRPPVPPEALPDWVRQRPGATRGRPDQDLQIEPERPAMAGAPVQRTTLGQHLWPELHDVAAD